MKRLMGSHRAIFFDVDDTLYDHLGPLRQALVQVMAPADDFPYEQVYHRVRFYSDLLSAQHGSVNAPDNGRDLQEMRENRFKIALAEFGLEVSREQAADIQSKYLAGQFDIHLFAGAERLIRELQQKGNAVGLITNGPAEHQMNKIRALALDKLLGPEMVFVSGAVGVDKPDPQLFTHVNASTGTEPASSWYIGDSWNNDVIGALTAGWTSVWFNHRHVQPASSGHDPHHMVRSYDELSRILLAQ